MVLKRFCDPRTADFCSIDRPLYMSGQLLSLRLMKPSALQTQDAQIDVGIYDCEVHLRFKLIEEQGLLADQEHLLEFLLDALSCGSDEYLEMLSVKAKAEGIPDTDASAEMRRQLIRLRNSRSYG